MAPPNKNYKSNKDNFYCKDYVKEYDLVNVGNDEYCKICCIHTDTRVLLDSDSYPYACFVRIVCLQ